MQRKNSILLIFTLFFLLVGPAVIIAITDSSSKNTNLPQNDYFRSSIFIPYFSFINSIIASQTEDYKFRPRGDREEGIYNQKITGKNINLISMSGIIPLQNGSYKDSIKVGLHLPRKQELNITVVEPLKRYKMLKLGKEFDSGFKSYAWPSTLPKDLNIQIDSLYAVALQEKAGRRFIVPCILYQGSFNGEIEGYKLTLWARKASDTKLEIIHAGTGVEVWSKSLPGLAAYKPYEIRWNARDNDEDKIQPGKYILNVKAAFHDGSNPDGEPSAPITFVYRFDHRWDFNLD